MVPFPAHSGSSAPKASRDVDQVVRNDPEPYPALHSVQSVIQTPVQPVPSLQHTNPPFTSHAPALTSPEPSLPLMRPSRLRLRTGPWQYHAPDTAGPCGLFAR